MRDVLFLPSSPPPLQVREVRRFAAAWLPALLWACPPLAGFLAARSGLGWELVALLGIAAAVAGTLAAQSGMLAPSARVILGLALVVDAALLAGAGHATLPPQAHAAPALAAPALAALSLAALALTCLLFDRRALAVAVALLLALAALPLATRAVPPGAVLEQAALLAAFALAGGWLQALLWRRFDRRSRPTILPPSRPIAPVPAPPRYHAGRPSPAAPVAERPVMVQVERSLAGTLRLAVATSPHAGRTMRVRVAAI